MNYELRITNKRKLILFIMLFVTYYILHTTSALAHADGGLWRPGDPIVPCGIAPAGVGPTLPCDQCQLFHLAKHIIDFIMVAATPIIGTLFLIIAGVHIMLGGTNPGMLSTGKRMFKDTLIGILIVMLAWLITNTLIRSLAEPTAIGGNWWEYSCVAP